MRPSRRLSWRCPQRSTDRRRLSFKLALALGLALLSAASVVSVAWAEPDGGTVLKGSFEDDDAEDGGTGEVAGEVAADGTRAPAPVAAGAARFDAALRLVATGREREAASELAKLAHERPGDDIAAEALFEAGLLYDDQLAEPETAQRLFRELCTRYPSSRLLKRAQQRLVHLDAALRTGAAPLVEFQAIIRSAPEGSRERQMRLTALLARHPSFALADHAYFLLADTALRQSDRPAAERQLQTLYRLHPRSIWTAQGHRLMAEWLLQSRQIAAARVEYQALEKFEAAGPLWPVIAREGLAACQRAQRQRYFVGAAWLYLGLGALLALWRGRRHLWPPPLEVWYYAPVAGFLALAGILVQSGTILVPLSQFAGLGAALTWLSAAAAQASSEAPVRQRRKLWLGLAARALAALAICYVIIYHHSLIELIVETLRNGPDAD